MTSAKCSNSNIRKKQRPLNLWNKWKSPFIAPPLILIPPLNLTLDDL